MQSLNRGGNQPKNQRVLEVGTSNSSLSAGESPQLLREQQILKPAAPYIAVLISYLR